MDFHQGHAPYCNTRKDHAAWDSHGLDWIGLALTSLPSPPLFSQIDAHSHTLTLTHTRNHAGRAHASLKTEAAEREGGESILTPTKSAPAGWHPLRSVYFLLLFRVYNQPCSPPLYSPSSFKLGPDSLCLFVLFSFSSTKEPLPPFMSFPNPPLLC
mmetsp:Transcript_25842/g.50645  ORF Transcript_25842/g.50645 Transcript_25842/m.50645 type:complete len:156 (-) Transcript_25842:947-1414(-)